MSHRIVTVSGLALVVMAGTLADLGAQRGNPKPALPGTAAFDCIVPDESRGLCASTPLVAELSGGGLNEMEIRDLAGDASAAMVLNFSGQRPEESPDPTDCSIGMGTCLWDWSRDLRSGDFISFSLGTNILDPTGTTEISGGLLGMIQNTVYRVRLNMTMTVPETGPALWKFNFNSTNPATGGGDPADVVRTGPCTWVFSATTERASLSTLVKGPKGKQYLHREGSYAMPFVLTFDVPNCGG